MQQLIPALRTSDFERSKNFYVDALGFKIEFEHQFEENFPIFALLKRDSFAIYLTEHAGDCQPGGLVYLYVSDVDEWHKQICAAGFTIVQPIDQPWNCRELRVKDHDGNTICISSRIEVSP